MRRDLLTALSLDVGNVLRWDPKKGFMEYSFFGVPEAVPQPEPDGAWFRLLLKILLVRIMLVKIKGGANSERRSQRIFGCPRWLFGSSPELVT